MVDEVIYAGGELESMVILAGTPVENTTAGHFDPTYSRCCIRCPTNGHLVATGPFVRESDNAITSIVTGDTMWFHCQFVHGGTSGVAPIITFYDTSGYPWFAISGNNPGVKPQYNSGTGPAPTWTNAGAGIAGSADTRIGLDVKLVLGSPHQYEVYYANSLVMSGTFTAAGFTSVAQVRLTGNASNMYCSWSEVLVTRGIPTVLAKVNSRVFSGVGNINNWTGAYTDANEIPISDANLLSTINVGDKFTFAMQDMAAVPTGFGVRSVFQWSRAKVSGAAPNNMKHVIRQAGVDYDSLNVAGINFGLGPVATNWGANAPGGGAWSKAIFDAIEMGAKAAT